MSVALTIVALVGFVGLTAGTALFVAAEFSLTALERSVVEAHARDGDRRARLVQRAQRSLSFQLSAAQLGITITTLITGYLAEPVLAQLFEPALSALGLGTGPTTALALALALILATSLSMVCGELVPKNVAIAEPMATARFTAGPLLAFSASFAWAIHFLNDTANRVIRRFGIEPAEELRSARSPQELGSLVRTSAQRGALDLRVATLVDRSLQFGERTAEELMTPRVKIVSLAVDDTVDDLVATSARTGFSRFPIVAGDLDDTRGFVHVKQAFATLPEQRAQVRLGTIVQRVLTVPATLDGDTVLDRVRADGMQVALVIDEYGGTAGIVTMEDLIEEIFGDVRDEHDDTVLDIRREGAGWTCSGLLRIDEVTAETGYAPPDGEYETLGGLILARLGRIPVEGDEVPLPADVLDPESDGWFGRVLAMDGRRIDRVQLFARPGQDAAADVTARGGAR
ncbi:hemolysin family protein [Skermania piniformis]|uniref:Hemolysin family protein n=1 Tax=Skermania pinensis TaxID=39122 RepID=A0ABX8S3S3_9ACTN|nr:hemolysin family protein [Skermania piniformis]QXQ12449.1 hemolysin family protein [Skermania piniformis]